MPPNPQVKAVNKKLRCGNYICLIPHSGLRTAFDTDKTIAHTKLTISRPIEVSIYQMMWCYCYHLRVNSKLRSLSEEDNFNNTFSIKVLLRNPPLWRRIDANLMKRCECAKGMEQFLSFFYVCLLEKYLYGIL